jgi:hypothetical protein
LGSFLSFVFRFCPLYRLCLSETSLAHPSFFYLQLEGQTVALNETVLNLTRAEDALVNIKMQRHGCIERDPEKIACVDAQVQSDERDGGDVDASFCLPLRPSSKDVNAEIEALQEQVLDISCSYTILSHALSDCEGVVCPGDSVGPSRSVEPNSLSLALFFTASMARAEEAKESVRSVQSDIDNVEKKIFKLREMTTRVNDESDEGEQESMFGGLEQIRSRLRELSAEKNRLQIVEKQRLHKLQQCLDRGRLCIHDGVDTVDVVLS